MNHESQNLLKTPGFLLKFGAAFLGAATALIPVLAKADTKPKFVCVEARSSKPFVVRATMVSDKELDDVVIRRVESKQGRVMRTLWQESAGSIEVDYRFHASSRHWQDSLPFRVEDEGPVSEATIYVPTKMSDRDGPTILRSRMKIKLKSGGPELDLRLNCART